jgi:hypothetical protein
MTSIDDVERDNSNAWEGRILFKLSRGPRVCDGPRIFSWPKLANNRLHSPLIKAPQIPDPYPKSIETTNTHLYTEP